MKTGQQHPTPEQLAAFTVGKLDEGESALIEEHLSTCDACCDLLPDLPDDTLVSLLQSEADTSVSPERKDAPSGTEPTLPPVIVEATQASDKDGTQGEQPVVHADDELPPELSNHPRYEVEGLIGRGGMGNVYRAQHRIMNRPVALKIISAELMNQPGAVDRFHREIQAASRLLHPNIVTAHDADNAGDSHFFIMEYVDGVDLNEVVNTHGPLPVAQGCDYIRQAAIGLQHAHDNGMVHRDIKPHNLMVTASGSQAGTSTIKILDFGLATFANETAVEEVEGQNPERPAPAADVLKQLTLMGTMMGTPDYIAPEQAEDAHTADIRSDIYSLGCTFYKLLTGEAPFNEDSVLEKIKAHSQAEAKPLSDYRDDVPPEVAAILNRMMAKDPVNRFQTPAEVAEALESVAVHVQPDKPDTKPRRAASSPPRRRRPLVLTAVATLFLAIIAAVVFYIQTDYGVVRVQVGDESLDVRLNGKTIKMKDGDTPLSIRTGQQKLLVRRGDFEFETESFQLRRGEEIALKVELLPGEIVVSKEGERFGAKELANAELIFAIDDRGGYFLNGRSVAPVDIKSKFEAELKESPERVVYLDVPSKLGSSMVDRLENIARIAGAARIRRPAWSDRAIVPDTGKAAVLLTEVRRFSEHKKHLKAGAISPDNSKILTAAADHLVVLHDAQSGEVLQRLTGHTNVVNRVAFSPDGKLAASVDWSGNTIVWDLSAEDPVRHRLTTQGGLFDVAWSADGRNLVVGGANFARLWDVQTGKETANFRHGGSVIAVACSPDGSQILSGGTDGDVRLWDVESGEQVRVFKGHYAWIESVAFFPDGKRIFSTGKDQAARVFDLESGQVLITLKDDQHRIHCGAISSDGKLACTGGTDGTVGLWDLESGRLLLRQAIGDDDKGVVTVQISADERFALSASGASAVLWRLPESVWPAVSHTNELQLLSSLKGHSGAAFGPSALVATADKRRLLTAGGTDCTARLWDVEAGELLVTMKTPSEQLIYAVAISADGKWAALRGNRGDLDIWDVTAEKRLHTLNDGIQNGRLVEFNTDGKRLVSIATKGPSFVWDVATGEKLLEHDLGELCRDIQFVPGKNQLLIAGISGWRLWDVETNEVTRLGEPLESIGAGAFDISADGSKFVSSRVHADQSGGKPINSYPIEIRDLKNGRVLAAAEGPDDFVYCVRFLPGEESVIATSRDKTIRVWNFALSSPDEKSNNRLLLHQTGPQHSNAVVPLAGDQVATFGYGSSSAVHVWQLPESVTSKFPLPNLELIRSLEGHEGAAYGPDSLVTTNDGRLLMSAGGIDRTARLWDVESGKMLLSIKTHSNQIIFQVALSGNGKWAAVRGRKGDLDIWDVEKKQRIHALDDQIENSTFTTFSPDGTRIVTIAPKGLSAVWDVASGEKLREHDFGDYVRDGKFLTGSNRLLVAAGNGWWVWDIESNKSTRLGPSDELPRAMALDVSADGSTFITSILEYSEGRTNNYPIELRDAQNGNVLARGEGHRELATSVRFLPGDRYVVSTSRDVTIRIWDTQAKTAGGERIIREIAREEVAKNGWNAVVPLPNNRLASFGQPWPVDPKIGSPIRIWQLPQSVWPKNELQQEASYPRLLVGHEGPISHLAVSHDGQSTLSASRDGTIRVWETATGKLVATLKGHTHWVNGAMFTPDGKFIVSVGGYKDKTLRIWDTDTWQVNRQWKLPGQGYKVAMPRHGMDIAVAGEFGMRVYDFETGEEKQVLEQKRLCFSVAYLPRGGIVANVDGRIKLFNERDGKLVWTTEFKEEEYRQGENVAYRFKESILKLDVSPDGKTIAAIGKQGIIYSLSPDNGEISRQWLAHDGLANIKFAPEGKQLFTAGHDKKLRMWDVATGKLLDERVVETHCTNVLAVLPDGERVVTGGGTYSQLIPSTTINAYETKTDGDYALRIWRFTEEQDASPPLQQGKTQFGDTTAESNDEEE